MTIVRGNVRANHIHALVSAPSDMSVATIAQYLKGKRPREFSELKKRYWGSHLWSRGYFCCTEGAVTEEMVKRYIEDQADTPDGFKVWDETSYTDASGAPAFRPIPKPSSLDDGR
jgi:putative transposase